MLGLGEMQLRPSVVKSQRTWSATTENDPSWGETGSQWRAYARNHVIRFSFQRFFLAALWSVAEEGRKRHRETHVLLSKHPSKR